MKIPLYRTVTQFSAVIVLLNEMGVVWKQNPCCVKQVKNTVKSCGINMQNFSQFDDKLQRGYLQQTNKAENVEIVHGKSNAMCQKIHMQNML